MERMFIFIPLAFILLVIFKNRTMHESVYSATVTLANFAVGVGFSGWLVTAY